MLRTTIIPQQTNINITIPSSYVGKPLEVLLYAIDELKTVSNEEQPIKRKPSEFMGSLSKDVADKMLLDIDNSRKEWERDI